MAPFRLSRLAAAAAVPLLLAGCSAAPAPAGATGTPAAAAASATASGDVASRHGLSGLDTKAIIERLDQTNDDRASGPGGSVRGFEFVLSDDAGEQTMALPEGQFYLALAPYENRTHDCFNHSTQSCQGELVGKKVHVTITDSTGERLVDADATTYPNGFVGFWLPRDKQGTIEVTYDGKKAASPFSTGADGASGVTTLPLR